ncbi:MAG: C13 family peptidase [Lentisphaeraceae bacterium]|nr:C13 family peptidase [Lentisphaeraceae bacterium]
MKISFKTIAKLLVVAFSFLLASCSSLEETEPAQDFALIYIGSSLRATDNELSDPVDKNAFFIEGAIVYAELIDRGVKSENIFFLYKDGKPDFDEPIVSHLKEMLVSEFSSLYDNSATVVNLQKVERQIQRQLKPESNFFLVIDGHGLVDKFGFKIRSEEDRTYIRSTDIEDLLKGNRGRTHLFIGSCYSGHFFKDVSDINARVVTAAPADKAVWLDRDTSFAREYFKVLPRQLSSSTYLYEKSFEKATLMFSRWGYRKMPFIEEEYEGKGLEDHDVLEWAPIQKNFNGFN